MPLRVNPILALSASTAGIEWMFRDGIIGGLCRIHG